MCVRQHNPLIGRFLQTDPVPGGSANAYDYAYQDPINTLDLDGRRVADDNGAGCSACHSVHPVVSFFSDKSYIDGFGEMLHGHFSRGLNTILWGQGPSAATNRALRRREKA